MLFLITNSVIAQCPLHVHSSLSNSRWLTHI